MVWHLFQAEGRTLRVAVVGLAIVVAACDDPEPQPGPRVNAQNTDAPPLEVPENDEDGDGFSPAEGDCDDADPTTFPDAEDGCDGVDNDCNSVVDDGAFAASVEGTHHRDVQSAVMAASEGAEVRVCDGVWPGALTLIRPITLVSLHGADVTILQPDEVTSVVTVNAHGVTLRGFTFQGGSADRGGGVNVLGAMDLVIEDCVFTNNSAQAGAAIFAGPSTTLSRVQIYGNDASDHGGGIAVGSDGSLTATDLTVSDNSAVFGAGVFLYGGARFDGTHTTTILANTADNGGGLYSWTGHAANVLVRDNVANSHGGGMYVFEDGSAEGVTLEGNLAAFGGGLVARGEVTLTDVTVTGNTATSQGGGLHADEAQVSGSGLVDLRGNTSEDLGGGAFFRDADASGLTLAENSAVSGGGVYISSSSLFASITGSVVEDNHALETGGGVLVAATADLVDVEVNRNNSDIRGGGIYYAAATGTVLGGRIADNTSAAFGGGVYLQAGSQVTLDGTVITGNLSDLAAGIYVDGDSDATLMNAVVSGNGDEDTSSGGGARVANGNNTLASVLTDWGTGADDNQPDDVATAVGGAFSGYGADASFTCDEDGCTPEP